MNNKMVINTYLSTIESKKQTKQTRRTETESWIQRAFDSCQMGGRCGGMGEGVRGLRSTNWQLLNSHGDVKYNIGNGVAKELIHTTHEHEQWGLPEEVGHAGQREAKGGKTGTTIVA